MDFEQQFSEWLENNLQENIPEPVKGLSFNLFESAGVPLTQFGITLLGSKSFSEDDSDWECDVVWFPNQRDLLIPLTDSGKTWEECLKKIKTLTLSKLNSNDATARKLKKAEGISIGFVDGDYEIIYKS